jgi:hypothetical protein
LVLLMFEIYHVYEFLVATWLSLILSCVMLFLQLLGVIQPCLVVFCWSFG